MEIENEILSDDDIDESILKLVYEKNLNRDDSILDLELNQKLLINNDKIKKKQKKNITSLQNFLKIVNSPNDNLRKFNPKFPPYNLLNKIK
jgi:hypothetical protein